MTHVTSVTSNDIVSSLTMGKRGRKPNSYWDDYCYVCDEGDLLMCCAKCPTVAHHGCVNLKTIPEGKWYCTKCDHLNPASHSFGLNPNVSKGSDSNGTSSNTLQEVVTVPVPVREPIKAFTPFPSPHVPSTVGVVKKKIKVLELFSGTGSISKYCKSYPDIYDPVISVDFDPQWNPTILTDIQKWNYSKYAQHTFDIIWASPPCTEFSRAKTIGVRDLQGANDIVATTLEIIDYMRPKVYFIENPATGLLCDMSYMSHMPYVDVDYCMYSTFGYRKRTRIYTNLKGFAPLKCEKQCGYCVNGKHVNTFGGGNGYHMVSLYERYRIPEVLIHKVLWRAMKSMT